MGVGAAEGQKGPWPHKRSPCHVGDRKVRVQPQGGLGIAPSTAMAGVHCGGQLGWHVDRKPMAGHGEKEGVVDVGDAMQRNRDRGNV